MEAHDASPHPRKKPASGAPAECCDCHQLQILPGVAGFLLLPENHCQWQAEYVRNQRHRQACAAQMVATGVRHFPAAAGATVRYRSLQWSHRTTGTGSVRVTGG
jgi:hypothetical protein